jgi:hypothetical protein
MIKRRKRFGRYEVDGRFTVGIPAQDNAASQPYPLPIPTGGWNTIAPLAGAPPDSAIVLDNFFPQAAYVELRRGFAEHCDTTDDDPVESLMPYHSLDGLTDAIFAAAGSVIYDVTTSTPASDVTALGSARWEHVQFATSGGTFLICCNGVDALRSYNGTAWATPSLTGITSTDIVDLAVHLNRLWFVEVDSQVAYFLPTGQIAGTVRPFPLRGHFVRGGKLLKIISWQIDGEGGGNDFLVFLSDRGEAVVFAGTDPTNANTWAKKGSYQIGTPIGRRCALQLGGDVAIICNDGVVPLSQALVIERSASTRIALTANIQPTMAESARLYGANFGWQLISYPRGTRAILNVPAVENDTVFQYVMNTVTGAWCRFRNQNANCWAILRDRIYYGGQAGLVYEADIGGNDNGDGIEGDLITAFHDLGNRGLVKHFPMVRPLITAASSIVPGIGINVDFQLDAEVSAQETLVDALAMWDVSEWDVALWPEVEFLIKNWQSTAAKTGSTVSIRLKVNAVLEGSDESLLRLNAIDIIATPGGFI